MHLFGSIFSLEISWMSFFLFSFLFFHFLFFHFLLLIESLFNFLCSKFTRSIMISNMITNCFKMNLRIFFPFPPDFFNFGICDCCPLLMTLFFLFLYSSPGHFGHLSYLRLVDRLDYLRFVFLVHKIRICHVTPIIESSSSYLNHYFSYFPRNQSTLGGSRVSSRPSNLLSMKVYSIVDQCLKSVATQGRGENDIS